LSNSGNVELLIDDSKGQNSINNNNEREEKIKKIVEENFLKDLEKDEVDLEDNYKIYYYMDYVDKEYCLSKEGLSVFDNDFIGINRI
jgi:hypothetical protein